MGGGCAHFFSYAGRLLALAKFDFQLMSAVFFHAVIGLERALRIHYKSDDETFNCPGSPDPLASLFLKAVEEGQITDGVFSDPLPLSDYVMDLLEERPPSHAETLARVVPQLRNQYFHGTFPMIPDFFPMTIQLREIADALKTKGVKSLID